MVNFHHFITICFIFLTINSYCQEYYSIINEIDQLGSPEKQVELLDYYLAQVTGEVEPDSLSLLYLKKSKILFRNTISLKGAIDAIDEGLLQLDESEYRNTWIELNYYKGYWYRKWDKYEQAKIALTKVLKYKEDNPREWSATIQLGKTYKDRGEFNLALDIYDKALELVDNKDSRLATTYEAISFVYLIMDTKNAANQAIIWLEKLIPLLTRMATRPKFLAKMVYNLGTAQMTLEQYELAEINFNKAQKILDNCCEDEDFQSLLYETKSLLLSEQGNYEDAIIWMQKSLDLIQHSFDLTRSDGLSSSYTLMAELYHEQGNQSAALSYINRAINYRLTGIESENSQDLSQREAFFENGEKHYLIDEFLLKAKILNVSQNRNLEAIKSSIVQADKLVDFMRFEHLESSTKEFWREKTIEVYQRLVDVFFELEDYNSAFYYAEKSKYLLMGEHLVQHNDGQVYSGLPDSLKTELHSVRHLVNAKKELLSKTKLDSDSKIEKELRFELAELRKKEDDILSRIKKDHPGYYESHFSFTIASVEQIQKNLISDNQSLVEYFMSDKYIYTFVINKQSHHVLKMDKPDDLASTIENLRNAIVHEAKNSLEQLSIYSELSFQLYTRFIYPIKNIISKDIIFINDNVLCLVPFSILLTEKTDPFNSDVQLKEWPYLSKKYTISYLKSGSIGLYQKQNKQGKTFNNSVLAFMPKFQSEHVQNIDPVRGNLTALSGILEELSFLKKNIQGNYFKHESATIENFRKTIQDDYAILHIASHAILDDEEPEYSKIVFTEDEKDGYLHSFEISNLKVQSDLVVLSACNTGFGKIQEGEGINSIGKAFFHAGSPNLLMSLWPISDKATSSLMMEYYSHLLAGHTKRESIGLAEQSFLQRTPAAFHHPYYWGGLVYYGDNNGITLQSSKQELPMRSILAIGLCCLLGLMLFQWRRLGFMKNRFQSARLHVQ